MLFRSGGYLKYHAGGIKDLAGISTADNMADLVEKLYHSGGKLADDLEKKVKQVSNKYRFVYGMLDGDGTLPQSAPAEFEEYFKYVQSSVGGN